MKKEPENRLINLAIKGNEDAWKEIYRRYHGNVRKVVAWGKWGFKHAEVEEVIQEVFLELIRALPCFRGEASLSTFLTRLSKNKCISILRRKSAQKRVKEEYGFIFDEKRSDSDEPQKQVFIESETGNPEFELLFEEESCQLCYALKQLSSECQDIIEKRYFSDLSYEEIAASLNLPLGTVCSRLKRCLFKLKEIYCDKLKKV